MDRLHCFALLEKVVVEPTGTIANIEKIVAMGPESKQTYNVRRMKGTDLEGARFLEKRFRNLATESRILWQSYISKDLSVRFI